MLLTHARPRAALALVVVAVLLATSCAGDGSGDGDDGPAAPGPDDLAAQVASFDLATGPPGRFLVGVLSGDNRFLVYGAVRLRFSFVGTGEGVAPQSFGAPVPARYLPVPGTRVPDPAPTEPRLAQPSEARGVYVAQAGFDRTGFWEVVVAATVGGQEKTATAAFEVQASHAVPAVGQQALRSENRTLAAGPDVPRAAIDSRAATTGTVPDPELHGATIGAALAAGRPVVAVFSTPVYCKSQFCGPVTDMVAELARDHADRATFVHVEIYYDFAGTTFNKAAADWLQAGDFTEPWVFVIGGNGVITDRFDNVATRGELEPVVSRLPVIGR